MQVASHASHVRVLVFYSPKSQTYWANSPDMDGLAASGKTRAEVEQEARWAAESLCEIAGADRVPQLVFQEAEFRPE